MNGYEHFLHVEAACLQSQDHFLDLGVLNEQGYGRIFQRHVLFLDNLIGKKVDPWADLSISPQYPRERLRFNNRRAYFFAALIGVATISRSLPAGIWICREWLG